MAGAALALLACTTVGTGSGMFEPGDAPVTFAWTNKDAGTSGTMTAMIGKTCCGSEILLIGSQISPKPPAEDI